MQRPGIKSCAQLRWKDQQQSLPNGLFLGYRLTLKGKEVCYWPNAGGGAPVGLSNHEITDILHANGAYKFPDDRAQPWNGVDFVRALRTTLQVMKSDSKYFSAEERRGSPSRKLTDSGAVADPN